MKYLAFILVLSLCSCHYDESTYGVCGNRYDMPMQPALSVIWKQKLGSELGSFTFNPYVWQDKVAYSISSSGAQDTIVVRNSLTGETFFEYATDNLGPNIASRGAQVFLHENLYVTQNDAIVKWNFITGVKESYPTDPAYINSGRLYYYDDYLYCTAKMGDVKSKLFRLNLSTGIMQDLIQLDIDNDLQPNIEISLLTTDQNLDPIVIFQNQQNNILTSKGKVDLYAMRIEGKKLLWKIDNITASGNSSISPGLLRGNRFYFFGDNSFYCFDIRTGKKVWFYEFPTSAAGTLFNCKPIIVNNLLIVKADDNTIWAFDPDTGRIEWQNLKAGQSPSDLTFNEKRLYYTSAADGLVYCHEIESGRVIWKYGVEEPKNTKQCFCINAVSIDRESGYLFVQDHYYLYCLQENF
ncbi:MAG: PQQ-binding-like beta-propeller repeat protein [Saprospiraceae bacterium]